MKRTLAYHELKLEIEEFLYQEADLLDQRKFRDWLDPLAENLVCFMPIRCNVKFGEHEERENNRQGKGISWFDEDKWTLTKRVGQILTGVHHAEEPLSRVTHMVSDIRLLNVEPSVETAMIELIAVPVGAKLSLLGGITAGIIAKIDGEWVKLRLLTVPEEKGRVGGEELCQATDVREVL